MQANARTQLENETVQNTRGFFNCSLSDFHVVDQLVKQTWSGFTFAQE